MAERSLSPAGTAAFRDRFRTLRASTGTTVIRGGAYLLALGGALTLAGTRLALNVPVAVPLVATPAWQSLAEPAALVGPAIAAIGLGGLADHPASVIGLVSVGTFCLLAAVAPAAGLPAVGATVAGGWLVAGTRLVTLRWDAGVRWRVPVVVATLLAGVALSLSSGVDLAPVTLRSVGSVLAAVGVATTPALVGMTPRARITYVLVAALGLVVGAAAPFVTGAIVLVVGGSVGTPFPLIALAVGGGAATVVTGLDCGRQPVAVGGLLLLAAGVPATLPRALAVTLAVALLLEDVDHSIPGGETA